MRNYSETKTQFWATVAILNNFKKASNTLLTMDNIMTIIKDWTIIGNLLFAISSVLVKTEQEFRV